MSDTSDRTMVEDLVEAPVSRRGFFARCGGAAAVGAVGVGFAGAAWGATGTKIFEGAYGLGAHRLVYGYFVTPRGRNNLDVVVIVPSGGKSAAAAKALARRHAAQGRLAVVPDLVATYGSAGLGCREAMTAALIADKARYGRLPLGSDRVSFVAA